ncbi:MAG: RnfABCDGE type electron transport complex subunit B [Gammaproteobacteria bacterium]
MTDLTTPRHGFEEIARKINALLPQTQCRRCGYAGCLPYAEAIARGDAGINQCPPGGSHTIERLAGLLGCRPMPLDPRYGPEQPFRTARVIEELCIGCTKCIQACPVDAILGAPKQLHTVFQDLCTGCELCLPPCPMDCIEMAPAGLNWDRARADAARAHFEARNGRLARENAPATQAHPTEPLAEIERDPLRRKADIATVIARTRKHRNL